MRITLLGLFARRRSVTLARRSRVDPHRLLLDPTDFKEVGPARSGPDDTEEPRPADRDVGQAAFACEPSRLAKKWALLAWRRRQRPTPLGEMAQTILPRIFFISSKENARIVSERTLPREATLRESTVAVSSSGASQMATTSRDPSVQ